MNRLFLALAPYAALAASAQAAPGTTLSVADAWSRATSPRAAIGAGFLTIRNRGPHTDRLLSASSPRAAKVEIHTMTMDGGIMRMRPLPAGLVIPANAAAKLAPGGNHIMLIGLKQPLREGETVPATLRFEHAGTIRVGFKVGAAGAMAPAGTKGMHQ